MPNVIRALSTTIDSDWPLLLWAAMERLLIRHPHDIQDHVRLSPSGLGGLLHVSTYIQKVRGDTEYVLVLDAGDVSEERTAIAFLDSPSAASDVALGDEADLVMRAPLLL